MTKPAPTKRTLVLRVPATEQEAACIDDRAEAHGLPRASYMRQAAMARRSTVPTHQDRQQVADLLRLQGDLGRLGGLFKQCIAKLDQRESHQPDELRAAFHHVLKRILVTQDEVLSAAKDLRKALGA